MIVKRIITNFATSDVSKARRFYTDILGLEVAMDLGWIVTFASPAQMAPQLSVATEGGSGTPVPDVSIEVDDLDEVERRVREEGLVIEYGPTTEPWGVRRFYVRDPLGRLVNILTHA
jgi:catechol 2,3-dioxygenase-like lactoylglutathione lyase family enzyme